MFFAHIWYAACGPVLQERVRRGSRRDKDQDGEDGFLMSMLVLMLLLTIMAMVVEKMRMLKMMAMIATKKMIVCDDGDGEGGS